MKKHAITILSLLSATCLLLPSCEKDDSDFGQYDFSNYSLRSEQGDGDTDTTTLPDTIALSIVWNGTQATVSGDAGDSVTISQGATAGDVVITSTTQRYLQLSVSGTGSDGSLLVYSNRMWGLVLNGITLNNPDGPAINNQCSKALYLTLADGTTNSLTDGTTYAERSYDQKGTLFSEGQIYFQGKGTLNVSGNCKNGIASDDYIVFQDGTVSVSVSETGTNGIKVNDGFTMEGGTLAVDVTAPGARGIRSEARTTFSGGRTTITTSGDCREETDADGVTDYTSCAGIKSDSLFTMTAGELTISSSGDGGKGINCDQNVEFSGGTLDVRTTGTKILAKPKGVKSDTGIILSGGSFTVQVNKSWACDNGSESSVISGMVTISGTPAELTLDDDNNKYVRVVF